MPAFWYIYLYAWCYSYSVLWVYQDLYMHCVAIADRVSWAFAINYSMGRKMHTSWASPVYTCTTCSGAHTEDTGTAANTLHNDDWSGNRLQKYRTKCCETVLSLGRVFCIETVYVNCLVSLPYLLLPLFPFRLILCTFRKAAPGSAIDQCCWRQCGHGLNWGEGSVCSPLAMGRSVWSPYI